MIHICWQLLYLGVTGNILHLVFIVSFWIQDEDVCQYISKYFGFNAWLNTTSFSLDSISNSMPNYLACENIYFFYIAIRYVDNLTLFFLLVFQFYYTANQEPYNLSITILQQKTKLQNCRFFNYVMLSNWTCRYL